VVFADARADALRRDFTINGLFFDPIADETCDWVGGEADLRAKLLRTIGTPEERFAEDHLRLLRAVRLAAQLGFQIESDTFAAVQRLTDRIARVSAERIRDELNRLFRPPHAAAGLELLRRSGLLVRILPELNATVECQQSPEFHPEGTVYQHIRKMLEQLPLDASISLVWAVILHDIAKPVTVSTDSNTGTIHFYGHEKAGAEMAEAILRRLRFPRKQIDEVVQCVRCHMQFKDVPEMRKATVRRMIMRPTFPLELQLHRLDCLGSHGSLEIYDRLVEETRELERAPEVRPPLLTGADLIALGMRPGRALGALLVRVRDQQLQGDLKNPEEARAWAAEQLKAS
jgi:poly(A) polymerase